MVGAGYGANEVTNVFNKLFYTTHTIWAWKFSTVSGGIVS